MSRSISAMAMILLWPCCAFASHPLITDDTGTQGKGKFQLEINGQYGREHADTAIQHTTPTASTLTYGVTETADVGIGIPYQWVKMDDSGTTARGDGFGDVAIGVKWSFFNKDRLSFSLKPGITFPTGDKDKGLGAGKTTYSLFGVATKEMKPWMVHGNLGCILNENALDQRTVLWHGSIAVEREVSEGVKLVANGGIQTNTDKGSHTDPVFILGGIVYGVTESIDIDAGYKYGLTKPETDHTILAGVTARF